MPYIVNFTDSENKLPITVYDNTSSTDTSLTFPGRNVSGYGQIVAENFLALLENFAKASSPVNPVEGQLWYDTSEGVLKIWDNTNWKAASNIQKSGVEPPTAEGRIGELWVDTTNQQLHLFNGLGWILVGPEFSQGLRSGPKVELVQDSQDADRVILIFYVEDVPIIIFSKDNFTPKKTISGFSVIRSGLNITSIDVGTGFDTKLWGRATSAENLIVADAEVPATVFLRSDVVNTTDFGFNVRNNSGITIGVDGTFNLSTSLTASKLYNSASGSSIDIQTNKDGLPSTVLRVIENKVGINVASPDEALSVDGNVTATGAVILTDTTPSTNLNNGTFRTAGGAAISKNLLIGAGLDVTGTTSTELLIPKATDTHDLGSVTRRWKTVRAKTIVADSIEGVVNGSITGNAVSATQLQQTTTFKMTGDVSMADVPFNGSIGGTTKIFNTTLTTGIISTKAEPIPNRSIKDDYVLVFRTSTGSLLKESRDVFVGDLGIPIGAILPYAGTQAPYGFLLCDGSEVEINRYGLLWDVIGTTFNGLTPLNGFNTYRLPDLRGRFPLGKDNMDNGMTVPNTTGGFIDAGGGNADRVAGIEPDTLGGTSGQPTTLLSTANLPQHEHNMQGSTGTQYYASRIDTAIPLDSGAFSDRGPTTVGQSQYLPSSGGIKTAGLLGQSFSIMNPFMTMNYIIRSGPPAY